MTDTLPRLLGVSTAAHALLAAAGLSVAARATSQHPRLAALPAVMFELASHDDERPRPPAPVVTARATPPRSAAPAQRVAPQRAPSPVPASAPSPVPASAPSPVPEPAAAPAVLTAPGGEGAVATGPSGLTTAPAGDAPSSPSHAPAGNGSPGVHEGAAFDAGAYLAGVTERVRRHRSYPALAQEMGLEGTVEVRVELHPDGSLAAPPSVAVSCGHEVLDDEALRIVRRAAPFPAMEGRDQRVTLRVPVHFHLES